MSPAAYQFAQKAFSIAGNAACADCGTMEGLTWSSMVQGVGGTDGQHAVILCNECCGGHRSLGVHLSKPLSLKMDEWDEVLQTVLLETGNAALNAQFEVHPAAATSKPPPTAEVGTKHAYIRSKYEHRAFCEGGDGVLAAPLGTGASASSAAVTAGQVHAGIAIVRVLRGLDLVAADLNGKSDPYVKLKSGGKKVKTHIEKATLNPVWNETLQLNVESLAEPISVEVMDHDVIGMNDHLGTASINLSECTPNEATLLSLPLEGVSKGSLELEVTWCPLDP
uniref:C2 domain-containing protein n=1 Tax=Haptolina ericina TaxID=156174 RepID=A0A7S3B3S4_9EUKA|mmetsp:Transcript_50338/g.113131  ORF Transcript_50338/g.113131 Transcript_50338/m.113131 type:complete len:280 (+) Transcript_50338:2-841(+)